MKQEYIDKFDIDKELFGFTNFVESYKNVIIQDVYELSFNNLYATIAVGLFESGIDFSSYNINKLKDYLENKPATNSIDYMAWKFLVNSSYGEIWKVDEKLALRITQYNHCMLLDICENNKSIIYVDTDTIYYTGDINLLDIDFKHELKKLKYFFISAKKKLIRFYENGDIKITGYQLVIDSSTNKNIKEIEIGDRRYSVNEIITQMKAINRNEQIDDILNN